MYKLVGTTTKPMWTILVSKIETDWKLEHFVVDHVLDSYYLLYWNVGYFKAQKYSVTSHVGDAEPVTTEYINKAGVRYKVVYLDSIKELDNSDQMMLSFRVPKKFTGLFPVVLVKRALP